MGTEERVSDDPSVILPRWDPEQQIYVDGIVPENAEVKSLLEKNNGYLRLFGYGSLCWNPGDGALSKPGVVGTLGRAKGYKRCWAQKSTDHRGRPSFPGIVCTLLEDHEVYEIRRKASPIDVEPIKEPTMTEGVIYLIPPELVDETLEELDFREKGGYARDVIDVVEDETQDIHQALLYRGTPDNPAFWSRALLDLPFAAAIISVAEGPSGRNDAYLNNLDHFLCDTHTIAAENDDTTSLAFMARHYQENCQLHFLFGCGSNQHNQLLMDRPNNAACLLSGDETPEMKEIVLCTDVVEGDDDLPDLPTKLFAGGGHSGMLTKSGKLFLWGWNESGQCGIDIGGLECCKEETFALARIKPLPDLVVETAALGFSHTLVIEKGTNHLFAFGNNERGQVNGMPSTNKELKLSRPYFTVDEKARSIAAGLFHSAVVTEDGDLITFGCGRFGQSLTSILDGPDVWIGRWRPDDGKSVVNVACGRRHTVVVDEEGRVWTFGENKYGQLGRPIEGKKDATPSLVHGIEPIPRGSTVRVDCGWSHNILHIETPEGLCFYYGWGRNDKGQLGIGSTDPVTTPKLLFTDKNLQVVGCGSESTMALDSEGQIWGTGWNEHGNLGSGCQDDKDELSKVVGTRVVGPPGLYDGRVSIAVGGAHVLAAKVSKEAT